MIMNKLCIHLIDNIFIFLESIDVIKLSITNTSVMNNCNESNHFKNEVNKYISYKYIIYDNIPLTHQYYYFFNNHCYICKLKYNTKKYTYNYNICHQCKSNNIHISTMKYGYKSITCNNYPFYNLSEYVKMVRDNKLTFMITGMNKRKLELESSLKKQNMIIPTHSKLCKDYILDRTKLSLGSVIKILCKNKYLYEYTPYNNIKQHLYYYNYLSWNQSDYYAKKMVLVNNKYPRIYPWK